MFGIHLAGHGGAVVDCQSGAWTKQGTNSGLVNKPPTFFDGKTTWGGFPNGGYFVQPCPTADCGTIYGYGFSQYRFKVDFTTPLRPVKYQSKNDYSHPTWSTWQDACANDFSYGMCSFALVGGSRLWIDSLGVHFNNAAYLNSYLWAD